MKPILRYTVLAVILTALGWKVYQALSPAPAQNAQETPALAVGDAESGIEAVCGKPVGISEKSGLTTYYFDSKEIDVRNGVIAAIRDSSQIKGALQVGDRSVVIDRANQLNEP